jgi:hypothetical protein
VACFRKPDPERGQYEVTAVGECGELHIDNKVVTPYGLTVIDCEAAKEIARHFVDQSPYRVVSISTGRCTLRGEGEASRFDCSESDGPNIPDVIGADSTPVRDSAGNISALVFQNMMGPDHLSGRLLHAGVAELTPECIVLAQQPEHFCALYVSAQERKEEQ